jgi:hypothetical protein
MTNEKLDRLQEKIEFIEAHLEDNPYRLKDNEFYFLYDELIDLYSVIKDEIYSIPVSELSEVSMEVYSEDIKRFTALELRINLIKVKIDKDDESDSITDIPTDFMV